MITEEREHEPRRTSSPQTMKLKFQVIPGSAASCKIETTSWRFKYRRYSVAMSNPENVDLYVWPQSS
jgi:hypothetical protein